jgi:hypothetical protein
VVSVKVTGMRRSTWLLSRPRGLSIFAFATHPGAQRGGVTVR